MHNPQDDTSRVDAVVCSKDRSCTARKLLGTLGFNLLWSTDCISTSSTTNTALARSRDTETRTQVQPLHNNPLRAGWGDVQLQMHILGYSQGRLLL